MRVYIGGSYSGRHRIISEIKNTRWQKEIHILPKWMYDDYFIERAWDQDFGGDVAEAMARIDESQIRDADVVIIDSIDPSSTGGYDTEFGIARGLNKMIIHIGPHRNVFFTLATKHYETWEDLRRQERMLSVL